MAQQHFKVFISWPGKRSNIVARALKTFLERVIQASAPFVSAEDIPIGETWEIVLTEELDQAVFGIVCITSGNLDSPWLNFEAGALARAQGKRKVAPYLLDVRTSDLGGHPLPKLQVAAADESGARRMVHSLNDSLGKAVSDDVLNKAFDDNWPALAAEIEQARQWVDKSEVTLQAQPQPQQAAAAEADEVSVGGTVRLGQVDFHVNQTEYRGGSLGYQADGPFCAQCGSLSLAV